MHDRLGFTGGLVRKSLLQLEPEEKAGLEEVLVQSEVLSI